MFSQCLSVYRGMVGGTNPTGMLCSYENFAQLTIQCNNWISAHMLVDCGGWKLGDISQRRSYFCEVGLEPYQWNWIVLYILEYPS